MKRDFPRKKPCKSLVPQLVYGEYYKYTIKTVFFSRILPLPTWYPYNWKLNPAFKWSFFTQTIALCLTDLCYLPTEIIFPYVSLITTGQFEILGTFNQPNICYTTEQLIETILGHNFKNIVYTALLDYGLPQNVVEKFTLEFNENQREQQNFLYKNKLKIINDTLQSDVFKNLINNRLNCYVKKHAALLEVCKSIEDTFSPLMLIKIFFNRMYIMMDILCVLYVINFLISFGKVKGQKFFRVSI